MIHLAEVLFFLVVGMTAVSIGVTALLIAVNNVILVPKTRLYDRTQAWSLSGDALIGFVVALGMFGLVREVWLWL